MFLRNLKIAPLICCLLASLCLSMGIILSNAGGQNDYILETTAIEETEVEEIMFTEIEEYGEASFQETMGSGLGREPIAAHGLWGRILFLAGGIFAVVFVFFMRQEQPFLGPEMEIIGIFLCMFSIRQPVYTGMVVYIGYLWFLFALLLFCIRGLWAWLRHGVLLEWSAAHRLGLLAVGGSEKQSRYLIFQMVFSTVELTAMMAFVMLGRRDIFIGLAGAGCLLGLILSVICFIRRTQDVDHLAEQVRQLHQGNPVSIREGVFAEDEEKLIDLNRQRDEAIKKAVVSERFKVDLIANVSHDLRTPLTAILGYGELLEEEKLSPKGEKQLEELNRKAGYMRDLVESLFELTKVSSGAVESRKAEIDLIRLLEQTIGLFDDQLNKKELQVRRHYGMKKLLVETDGARMHQVFANLIGNAIKYTLPGTRIHLEVKDSDKMYLIRMVNIASYEMDFEPEEILERFARGDKARTTKGSGLGLAIAQTYTESVGGTFKVEIDGEQFSAIVALPKN